MTDMELLWQSLDQAIWEMGEAFKDLPDEDVWTRADERLLSVGELAAHVGFGESDSFMDEDFDSPFVLDSASYYTTTVEEPFELPMTAEEVYAEIQRIHEACKEAFLANPASFDEPNPHREGWTWGYTLQYQAFHIAYHTGQIYSVRHLLGHETTDN